MPTDTPGTPQTRVRLADYRPPDWLVDDVALTFDLAPAATRVTARLRLRRNPARAAEGLADLALDGRRLTLVEAAIDDRPVEPELSREGLRVPADALPRDRFTWECVTEIDPKANTALEGLYMSRAMYCTQCEAEGFRKITFYPDRPDVMAPFRVRIEADRERCPVLLSNGNPVGAGDLGQGWHYAEWEDPYPKPSYLFALMAGNLVSHDDSFTTMSGREVALRIYVRPGDEDKCAHAMASLKRAMRWDEETHGREYDLDLFMIVAVDDFNMGAMENKGLNIFNSKYILASPETATDRDYELIDGIVAHEYFHNWTGNRITCRDWFQLCLKEGLTVFRDQEYTADQRSRAVKRIGDVKMLRARQFREDAGPLAHPVRPKEYVEINNFYTATVYEKGAEVIRMLRELVGPEGYRKALDLYFARHDGQACTVEDFRRCFEDACGRDLSDFARWWSQAGTPRLAVAEHWADGRYVLTLRQRTPPTPGQPEKAPLVIPVAVGLIGPNGEEVAPTDVLELTAPEQSFACDLTGAAPRWQRLDRAPSGATEAPGKPVPSLLRGFSAPVILERESPDAECAFLMAHDTDPFNRWQAGRAYAIRIALRLVEGSGEVPAPWIDGIRAVLADESQDPAFRALAAELPGVDEISQEIAARGGHADPDAIHAALTGMRRQLGEILTRLLEDLYELTTSFGPYSPDPAAAGRRALRNRCLALLGATRTTHAFTRAERQHRVADNMTDGFAALAVLTHDGAPSAGVLLAAFHDRWRDDPLVIDKWLALQATAPLPGTLEKVRALTAHPAFDWRNPNRFRALIGAFAESNPVAFHAADGSGYRFVADWLLKLDPLNPQTAARVAGAFETLGRYDAARQALMRAELERMAGAADLSRNTREIVERILGR